MTKYTFPLGMGVRAYGSVSIEADTPEAAEKLLTAEYVAENFDPYGGSEDISFDTPMNISVLGGEFEDENGEEHQMEGAEDVVDGPWIIRPLRDDLKEFVEKIASLTTSEEAIENNPDWKIDEDEKSDEAYLWQCSDEQLHNEYVAFMDIIRRARTVLKGETREKQEETPVNGAHNFTEGSGV